MAKDPAFLFYPNDYIGGTMGLTFEEKGAYMELLMMQFNRGHMTKDMIGRVVGQLWDVLEDKFQVDEEGKYFNKRLEEEQIKRKRFTDSRKNNKKGKNQHTKKGGHMTLHMEDENENEDKSKDVVKKEVVPYENFIKNFNEITGKRIRIPDDKFKRQFRARLKEGFTMKDILEATENCSNDEYHLEKGLKYLTPEFITRADKLQKYLNNETNRIEKGQKVASDTTQRAIKSALSDLQS